MNFLKNTSPTPKPLAPVAPASSSMATRWPLVILMVVVVGGIVWVATAPPEDPYTITAPNVPVAPVAPPVDPPVVDPVVDPAVDPAVEDARPTSTSTTLGSRSGLGGGPLVGSQSTRLGGSAILPGRRVNVTENRFENRKPQQIEKVTVLPPPAPAGPVAPAPKMQIAPRKKQYATFAPPLPYQPVGQIIIDSRDGQIIQPR